MQYSLSVMGEEEERQDGFIGSAPRSETKEHIIEASSDEVAKVEAIKIVRDYLNNLSSFGWTNISSVQLYRPIENSLLQDARAVQ